MGTGGTDPEANVRRGIGNTVFIILLTLPAVKFCGLKKKQRERESILVNIIRFHC